MTTAQIKQAIKLVSVPHVETMSNVELANYLDKLRQLNKELKP